MLNNKVVLMLREFPAMSSRNLGPPFFTISFYTTNYDLSDLMIALCLQGQEPQRHRRAGLPHAEEQLEPREGAEEGARAAGVRRAARRLPGAAQAVRVDGLRHRRQQRSVQDVQESEQAEMDIVQSSFHLMQRHLLHHLQGDTSRCFKPPVHTDLKLGFSIRSLY